MSFAFGFSGDDIESDGSTDELANEVSKYHIDDIEVSIAPKRHTLQELLNSLPSQVSYNFLQILTDSKNLVGSVDNSTSEQTTTWIPRRSVFDIRTQLMAEANPDINEYENLIAGLDQGDLSTGVYEGGFKTWECSLDLAAMVSSIPIDQKLHVIELGAGSAVPSLVLLQRALRLASDHKSPSVHFTLCDYNEDVLRLATAPNIFFGQQVTRSTNSSDDQDNEHELEDIDEVTVTGALKNFQSAGISFGFVSGAWGDEFISLLRDEKQISSGEFTTLILASETIYSPASTAIFADTLMQLLKMNPRTSKAWVAAKKVYFGVGGSVEDFAEQIAKRQGITKTILDIGDAGVARVILEVEAHIH